MLSGTSGAGNVLRLQTLPALGYLVGHLVAFFEGLEPISGYARVVHEDVFAPIIRRDEAVALLVAEPLDRTFWGHTVCARLSCSWAPPNKRATLLYGVALHLM